MKESKKKVSLLGCMTLGIGCIIGSGIFGSLPEVIGSIGDATITALILATIYTIIKVIPGTFNDGALVTSARTFMQFTKVIHPVMGMLEAINYVFITSMLALYGVLFGEYILVLFPNLPISENIAGIIFVLVFSVIALFGVNVSSLVQNIMVALLFIGLLVFSITGILNLDPSSLSFEEIIGTGAGISGLSAAVAVLSSSLSGAGIIGEIGSELENPKRDIPLALIFCPIVVCAIYVLMALSSLSADIEEFTSLSQVAELYMSPTLFVFFVICGPMIAIVTSFIPYLLSMVAAFEYLGVSHILPEVFATKNKYNVAYLSLMLAVLITVIIIGTGQTFGIIMVIFSFANMIETFPGGFVAFLIPKRYPNIAANTKLYFPMPIIKICSVLLIGLSIYLAIQLIAEMNTASWIACLVTYSGGFVYLYFRSRYLKKRDGKSLMEYMREPFEPWEALEKSYK